MEKCREGATWVLCDGAGLASPRTTSGPQAMYRATTRSIEVTATPQFLDERSSPANNYYFWAYTIDIVNRASETVQLLSRHWRITDAFGPLQEPRRPGAVRAHPVLGPGHSLPYTSDP